ncbi:hypothetical protein CBI38_09320 [Rhodococcus oxybenzonivorans]|uniref:AB hydrolase-1 domain-containing protein n=1 Tax=Rhodococcus oxybenzonivorans TaxID=1990687 RepID=A0A2S2BT11_9NOCA|nr:alpha/beta fold hydrolase [Rhodococcus oxybenzonivorans]AWK71765.1 hypothetical protein CBI38_09320 [Rhodococcus oxybenzonivorans]
MLVSGAIAAADTWSAVSDPSGALVPSGPAVYPQVAAFAQVCAYDRPGSARIDDTFTPSTPIPQPTTPRNAVADLHALLTAADVPGPYVLARWSMGGPIARVYAGTHSSDVSGLVLVDGTSEYLQAELTPTEFGTFLQMSAKDEQAVVAQWSDVERFDLAAAFAELRAAPPVPDIPVIVLSADEFDANAIRARLPADAPPDYPEVFWRAQLASQNALAGLFPRVEHVGHQQRAQHSQPITGLIVGAIRDLVAEAEET